MCLSAYLSLTMSKYLSVFLPGSFVCLSVCLSVCLFLSVFFRRLRSQALSLFPPPGTPDGMEERLW